jgi:hypothetical protein
MPSTSETEQLLDLALQASLVAKDDDSDERLSILPDGRIAYRIKKPWRKEGSRLIA